MHLIFSQHQKTYSVTHLIFQEYLGGKNVTLLPISYFQRFIKKTTFCYPSNTCISSGKQYMLSSYLSHISRFLGKTNLFFFQFIFLEIQKKTCYPFQKFEMGISYFYKFKKCCPVTQLLFPDIQKNVVLLPISYSQNFFDKNAILLPIWNSQNIKKIKKICFSFKDTRQAINQIHCILKSFNFFQKSVTGLQLD